jgi:hypothetical protein
LGQLAEALARDVGRLRRTLPEGWLVDRFAGHAWMLAGFVEPTAAAIYRENGGDVDQALADVDERARRYRRLLGEAEPR